MRRATKEHTSRAEVCSALPFKHYIPLVNPCSVHWKKQTCFCTSEAGLPCTQRQLPSRWTNEKPSLYLQKASAKAICSVSPPAKQSKGSLRGFALLSLTQKTNTYKKKACPTAHGVFLQKALISSCFFTVWDQRLFYIKPLEKPASHYHLLPLFPHPSVRLNPARE